MSLFTGFSSFLPSEYNKKEKYRCHFIGTLGVRKMVGALVRGCLSVLWDVLLWGPLIILHAYMLMGCLWCECSCSNSSGFLWLPKSGGGWWKKVTSNHIVLKVLDVCSCVRQKNWVFTSWRHFSLPFHMLLLKLDNSHPISGLMKKSKRAERVWGERIPSTTFGSPEKHYGGTTITHNTTALVSNALLPRGHFWYL